MSDIKEDNEFKFEEFEELSEKLRSILMLRKGDNKFLDTLIDNSDDDAIDYAISEATQYQDVNVALQEVLIFLEGEYLKKKILEELIGMPEQQLNQTKTLLNTLNLYDMERIINNPNYIQNQPLGTRARIVRDTIELARDRELIKNHFVGMTSEKLSILDTYLYHITSLEDMKNVVSLLSDNPDKTFALERVINLLKTQYLRNSIIDKLPRLTPSTIGQIKLGLRGFTINDLRAIQNITNQQEWTQLDDNDKIQYVISRIDAITKQQAVQQEAQQAAKIVIENEFWFLKYPRIMNDQTRMNQIIFGCVFLNSLQVYLSRRIIKEYYDPNLKARQGWSLTIMTITAISFGFVIGYATILFIIIINNLAKETIIPVLNSFPPVALPALLVISVICNILFLFNVSCVTTLRCATSVYTWILLCFYIIILISYTPFRYLLPMFYRKKLKHYYNRNFGIQKRTLYTMLLVYYNSDAQSVQDLLEIRI